MNKKINTKQKLFIDTLFKNNFNQVDAYTKVYAVSKKYAGPSATRLMSLPHVKAYYNHLMEQYRKTLDIDKQKMIDNLMRTVNMFEEMLTLASKESPTDEETSRLERLTSILKGSDANKAKDMLIKMIGAYEPEKQEIEHKGITFNYITPEDKKEDKK